MEFVRIVGGVYAPRDGEVVSVAGDEVSVRIMFFDAPRLISVSVSEVEFTDDRPASLPVPIESVERLRLKVAADFEEWPGEVAWDYFVDHADEPETDLAGDWDHHAELYEAAKQRVGAELARTLKQFDERFAESDYAEVNQHLESEPQQWLPARAAAIARRKRYPRLNDSPGIDPEEKLLAAIEGRSLHTEPSRFQLAVERRAAAREAAELRDYRLWAAKHWPQPDRDREAAQAKVAATRSAVSARFRRDWGMELPESMFRFRAFLLSLPPMAQQGMEDLELMSYGIMAVMEDPEWQPEKGEDSRMYCRAYRDPPEFVTFMHGGTDGLHFGLWFDDGVHFDGVNSYYNNDGGGVGLAAGTPLGAVRSRLESGWDQRWDDIVGADWPDPELIEHRYRLRLLREAVMAFETAEHPQIGEAYSEAVRRTDLYEGHADRVETLDGAGVRADTVIVRGPQKPWDDYDFCTKLEDELTGDRAARLAHIATAKQRCREGNPGDALALGRDLHWCSRGNPEIEDQALELLTMAYQALGRDNLAGMARVHYEYRLGIRKGLI